MFAKRVPKPVHLSDTTGVPLEDMLQQLRGGETSHEGEGRLPALLLETRASYSLS